MNQNFQQKNAITRQSKEDNSYGREGFGINRPV